MFLNSLGNYINNSLINVRFFTLIILFVVIFIFCINNESYNLFFTELHDKVKFLNNKIDGIYLDENENKCKPFINKNKQFYQNIDGEIYPKIIPLFLNQSINFDCLNKSKVIKKILIWNGFFGDRTFWYGSSGEVTPFVKNKCPVTSCEILNDKSRLNESDYVLVHMRDSFEKIPVFPNRKLDQKWIFTLYESPRHSSNYTHLNGLFNLTSTYRLDSNFSSYYAFFSKIYWTNQFNNNESLDNEYIESQDYLKGKNYFASAIISNCGGSSKRLELIKILQKYIQVDIYGNCGRRCPEKYLTKEYQNKTNNNDCKDIISREYKFFFAFENSLCKDYVTEKFFDIIFRYPIIPVVLGHGESSDIVYSHYIPRSGYINALNFKTPKDLADYLLFLSKNATAYNSYFKWKKYARKNKKIDYHPLCEMCIKLQLEAHYGIETSVINDLGNYWSGNNICKHPLYSII